ALCGVKLDRALEGRAADVAGVGEGAELRRLAKGRGRHEQEDQQTTHRTRFYRNSKSKRREISSCASDREVLDCRGPPGNRAGGLDQLEVAHAAGAPP